MKRLFVFVFLLSFLLSSCGKPAPQKKETEITKTPTAFYLKDSYPQLFLKMMESASGKGILAPEGFQKKLGAVTIEAQSWQEALSKVLEPLGFSYEIKNNTIVILSPFPNVRVEGIMYDKKNPTVVINGLFLKIGDKIEGAEVIEITKDIVKFKYKDTFFANNLEYAVSEKSSEIIKEKKTVPIPMPTENLPIDVRKKIFYEVCEAENRAIKEAKAKYPFSGTLNKEEAGNRSEMHWDLMKKYRKEVWDEYNISEDQGVEIGGEGIDNHWPQCPWESPW